MNYIIRVLNGIRYRLNYLYFNGYLMPRRRAKIGLTGGKGVELGKNIQSLGSGKLVCGDKCRLHDNVSFCFNPINGNTPEIRIGKGASIGKYNDFGCSLLIEIEEMVITAPFVHFTDRNHCYEDIDTPIMYQPTSVKGPIKIGAGSWLGFGVQVMSGVTIGKHCVVAAASVVTKDIPDYSVAGGNPAKILKRYNFEAKKWVKA